MDLVVYLKKLNKIDTCFKTQKTGVNIAEFRLLHEVKKASNSGISALSHERNITPQSFGRMCASLATRGLISVEKDTRDKRAKRVSLTRKGASAENLCCTLIAGILDDNN